MRLLLAVLPVVTGCATTISSQPSYDSMLEAARTSDRARVALDHPAAPFGGAAAQGQAPVDDHPAAPFGGAAAQGQAPVDDHPAAPFGGAAAQGQAPVDDARVTAAVSAAQLDRRALIEAVLGANRDVEAMRQGLRAALAEVSAAGALDDPMARYELAPLSIGSSDARFGQRIELSQKLPWPGKRALAQAAAVADADVIRGDLRASQVEVAALASQLYDDAYFNARAREVNDQHRGLVEQMKRVAEARLASGRGSTQDALAAEVELGHLEHDRVMLETERITIDARVNGLLHRDPAASLPPPPSQLSLPGAPEGVNELAQRALAGRAQRAAADARVRADEARVRIAERASYPDFEIMASYDSMWDMPEHRWMVGIGIDVPIQRSKRAGDAAASQARVAQAQAVRDRVVDDIRVEVTRAHRDIEESIHVVQLYDARLLPAARAQVDAALAGFTAAQNDFSAVIGAERGLREVQLAAFRARADAWRRQAALDRALGRLPGDQP